MNLAPILEEWQKAASKELDFRFEYAHQQRAFESAEVSGSKHKRTPHSPISHTETCYYFCAFCSTSHAVRVLKQLICIRELLFLAVVVSLGRHRLYTCRNCTSMCPSQRSGIGVIIPKCYSNLVTKSVMVMEYIEGFKVTDTAKLDVSWTALLCVTAVAASQCSMEIKNVYTSLSF